MDPKLLASGSDDAKGNYIMMFQLQVHPPFTHCFSSPVKLWSTNLDNSVASIEAKANVCCVKFSPTSRYHLAFGCAGKIKPAHMNPDAPDKTVLPRKGKVVKRNVLHDASFTLLTLNKLDSTERVIQQQIASGMLPRSLCL